jgi:P2X purinoceptor 7
LPNLNITCTFHKTQNPQCPIFRLGDIFWETGDNFSDVAIQVGGVFVQRDVCQRMVDVK